MSQSGLLSSIGRQAVGKSVAAPPVPSSSALELGMGRDAGVEWTADQR